MLPEVLEVSETEPVAITLLVSAIPVLPVRLTLPPLLTGLATVKAPVLVMKIGLGLPVATIPFANTAVPMVKLCELLKVKPLDAVGFAISTARMFTKLFPGILTPPGSGCGFVLPIPRRFAVMVDEAFWLTELPALKNKLPGVERLDPAEKMMLPVPGVTAKPLLFHPATKV